MNKIQIMLVSIAAVCCYSLSVNAQNKSSANTKFTKCKDENGIWHYGSSNLYKCPKSSDITVLNDRGVLIEKVAPVKTQEELEAEVKKQEEERLVKEEMERIEKERERILTVYQSEEDIKTARERALTAVDIKINQHQSYIEALSNQERVLNDKIAKDNNFARQKIYKDEVEQITPKKEYSANRVEELKAEKVEINNYYDKDLAIFNKFNN